MEHVNNLLPAIVRPEMKPLTPIKERLLSMPLGDEEQTILYQHSVLAQTCMPYRNPGDDVRIWRRQNGRVSLRIQAGVAWDASKDSWIDMSLPYGTKPRLVLYHLNAEALRTQSSVIELEDSLTAFVKRTLGLDPKGRNIRIVKDQLSRLAAAEFRFGMGGGDRSITIKGTIIDAFELWTPREARQQVLWPTVIHFSQRYFDSLVQHAVPLNEAAVARLSHSAMALDLYGWLAQRLHRVDPSKPAFVPWMSLKQQFGFGYARMDNFKGVFRTTLKQVHAVYSEARFTLDDRGATLRQSAPPVVKRYTIGRGE